MAAPHRLPRTVVLDSWAVMAYFQGEPSSAAVVKILAEAQEDGRRLVMSVVNAGEVWCNYARRASERVAEERILQLRMLGVEFISVGWDLAWEASRLKSRYPIAYADCFAAALAKSERGRLLTGDPAFRRLASEKGLVINWI